MMRLLIELWEDKIKASEKIIAFYKEKEDDDVMLAIAISRRNQLEECINDLKKFTQPVKKPCRKKRLSKGQADKIVCRDDVRGLNNGKKAGSQRTSYFCDECKAWHTSTMISGNPVFNAAQ